MFGETRPTLPSVREQPRPGRDPGLDVGLSLLTQRRQVSVGGQSERASWRRWRSEGSMRWLCRCTAHGQCLAISELGSGGSCTLWVEGKREEAGGKGIRLVPARVRRLIPGPWPWGWRPDVWWSWGIVASVRGNGVRRSQFEKEGSQFAPSNSQEPAELRERCTQ